MAAAEQDEWLERAEKAGWLRHELRGCRRGEQTSVALASLILRVPVARERAERRRAAARRSDDLLENWILLDLDRAAEDALTTESPHSEWGETRCTIVRPAATTSSRPAGRIPRSGFPFG